MPIHAPSPQLFSSIPFKHLGGKNAGGRKGVSASLNLTAMVDMMTMLVVFLLSTFSATGELLMNQKGVELPIALNDSMLERAPIVTVSKDSIAFKGEAVADPRSLLEDTSSDWKIVELYDRLQLEKFNFDKQEMDDDLRNKLRGLLVLQCDKGVEAKILNRIMKTAYAAEYTDVMFAIQQGGKAGGGGE